MTREVPLRLREEGYLSSDIFISDIFACEYIKM